MNYRSLALAIAAWSSAYITTAAAQPVYVAPGGVYIGGGPVYVIPAPGNGNGTYVEPTYYGNGVPEPYLAPTGVAPDAGYVVTPYGPNGNGYGYRYGNGNGYENGYGYENGVPDPAPYLPTVLAPLAAIAAVFSGLNGNGYGNGYRNGYGAPRPPVYYNGDPLLSTYGSVRLPRPPAAINSGGRNGNTAQSLLRRPGGPRIAKQNGGSEYEGPGEANRRSLVSVRSGKSSALSAPRPSR